MLQIANAFFKLPGDYLKPGEEEVQGLKERLNHILAPLDERGNPTEGDWEIGDCIAQWWRPNFETFMVSIRYITSLLGTVLLHSQDLSRC